MPEDGDIHGPRDRVTYPLKAMGKTSLPVTARHDAGLILAGVVPYPFLLDGFHRAIGGQEPIVAALWLALAFLSPALCLTAALRLSAQSGLLHLRRLALTGVMAPTVYVFLGVLLYMAGSPVPDEIAWLILWVPICARAILWPRTAIEEKPVPAALRVAHGIAAALVSVYVLFHVGNHLFGLIGPERHLAVMKLGRQVYRNPFAEPLLVALMLFQIGSGLVLAWRWSAKPLEGFRVFQLASGFYLSLFILGHMNSVFVFARAFLHIQTGWDFATGAPTGLIQDPWNIRLVPHYWLGVFFVLSHLASGLRVVLAAHGVKGRVVNGTWVAGLAASAAIATLILMGMCGVRL